MDVDKSVVGALEPRVSSFTNEVRRPFDMTPDPWASLDVPYVGQDPSDSRGGCSQKSSSTCKGGSSQGNTAAPSKEVDVQVGHTYSTWTTPSGGAIVDTTHSSPSAGVLHNPQTSSPAVSYAPQPAAPISVTGGEPVSAIGWTQTVYGRGNAQGKSCQVEGCPIPPSYSFDGSRPAFVCEIHRRDDMKMVLRDEATRDKKGCGRGEEGRHTSTSVKPDQFGGLEHNMLEVIATETKHCEFPDCMKAPKYGHKDGPLNFCQSHKRAGMYTIRHGNLLIATRDGSAFRQSISSTTTVGSSSSSTDAPHLTGVPEGSSQEATEQPEGEDSGAPTAVGTTPSPASKLTPLYRKLCEVAGCPVQPSYGPQGTSRPRFCAGHKTKDMIGLKNRPCLFPGCITRPHYGLSRGRPMYCTSHKKSGMVHLLKESMTIAKERIVRKRAEARRVAAEKKGLTLPTYGPEKHYDVGEGLDEDDERSSEMGRWGGYMLKLAVRGKEKQTTGGRVAPRELSSTISSSVSSSLVLESASSRNEETSTKTPSDPSLPGQREQSPRPSRLADTSGMAPSAEFKLLQEARELARAEAEASGLGRRPRAPSRKLLEASGRVQNEGAQWMTKEIKEAEAKKLRDLKEQRRKYKAAGLKAGHVMEECSESTVGAGRVGLGASVSIGDGGVGTVGGVGGLSDKHSWRQLTTAEILQQVRQPVSMRSNRHEKGRLSRSVSGRGPGIHKQGEGEDTAVSVAMRAAEESAKKRKEPAPDTDDVVGGADATGGDAARRSKTSRQHTGERREDHLLQGKQSPQAKKGTRSRQTIDVEGEGEPDCRAECEFAGCPKTAKFGVNGIVRYCAKHRLFGMHEMDDNN